MIKSDTAEGIAVLTLTHGKVNALDIEFVTGSRIVL